MDALAHEDDEGRKWTKTRVSSQKALTPRYPNGETRLMKNQSSLGKYIAYEKLDPANWNILVAGGKERKLDFPSSGERKENSPTQ